MLSFPPIPAHAPTVKSMSIQRSHIFCSVKHLLHPSTKRIFCDKFSHRHVNRPYLSEDVWIKRAIERVHWRTVRWQLTMPVREDSIAGASTTAAGCICTACVHAGQWWMGDARTAAQVAYTKWHARCEMKKRTTARQTLQYCASSTPLSVIWGSDWALSVLVLTCTAIAHTWNMIKKNCNIIWCSAFRCYRMSPKWYMVDQ